MIKAIYKTTALFSLKKYDDSNLKAQSYEYPTVYSVRSAILGSIIEIEGIEKAKELFHKIKNANIYVALNNKYKTNGVLQRRCSNAYYQVAEGEDASKKTTIGFRQYVHMDNITIYIDNLIPEIEIYLKNIDRLGTAESMIYLNSISECANIDNVLVQWDGESNCSIYEQWDWDNKSTFENIYMYSSAKRLQRRYMSCVKNIMIN